MDNNTKIAFGKHTGKKLSDIPDSYFKWLMKQEDFIKSTDSYNLQLKQYINDHRKNVKKITVFP